MAREEPETVRKLAAMLPKMEMNENNKQLLLMCGLALDDVEIAKKALELGADPTKEFSRGNIITMGQLGYTIFGEDL
tara:strand:- start:8 stop:238 length:231 start_codon:yes stop_codon:yes gene_type:complete